MSHVVIISGDGTGPGGSAQGEIKWQPAHDMSPAEEAKRREKAQRLLDKANDALYEERGGDED